MKKLVKRYLEGNSINWSDVGDAASYMIPVYGTYRSFEDAINDPSLANWGLAGLSLLGDLGYVAGFGAALKGVKASSAAAKAYLGVAGNYERIAADIAKEASKINPKSSVGALKKADNLANDAIETWKTVLDYRAIAAKEKQGISRNIKNAGRIAAGSTAAFKGPKSIDRASELDKNKRESSTLKKTLKKVTPSNGDLVRKRTEPFLYNNFLKKDGGTIKKLIPKHLLGGSVEDEDPNIVWDAVKSITPGVGTYYDIKEAVNDPTVGNILGAGASLGSDLALLVPGVGWIAQANRARKAGKIASLAWKAAGQYYKWGRNATKSAQELDKAANTAKKVGNVRKYDKYRSEAGRYKTEASDLNKRMKTADLEFINASKQKKAAKAAIESYKDPMLVGAAGRIADADVNAYRDLLKKLNLVEKRQNPYLYNNFTH